MASVLAPPSLKQGPKLREHGESAAFIGTGMASFIRPTLPQTLTIFLLPPHHLQKLHAIFALILGLFQRHNNATICQLNYHNFSETKDLIVLAWDLRFVLAHHPQPVTDVKVYLTLWTTQLTNRLSNADCPEPDRPRSYPHKG